MASAKGDAAAAFTKLVEEDRIKNKAQKTADQIFGKRPTLKETKRQASTGSLSLADRIGGNRISKRPTTTANKASNIDGRWGHDLHHINNPRNSRGEQPERPSRPSSTSALDKKNRLYDALKQSPSSLNKQFNVRSSNAPMSIKGAATPQPTVVIMSNLAPGTSPADIEAAVKDVAGKLVDCYLISEAPTIIAELLCEDRRGAQKLVDDYNNSTTDGRLLNVYIKPGGPSPRVVKDPTPPPPAPVAPIRQHHSVPATIPTEPAADSMDVDGVPERDDQGYNSRSTYDRDGYRSQRQGQDRRYGNYYGNSDRQNYWSDTRGSRGYYDNRSYPRGRGGYH